VAGEHAAWLSTERPLLLALARLDDNHLRIVPSVPEKPRQAIALVLDGTEVYLPLEGLVDLAGERGRLAREVADFARQIEKSAGLLASDFAAKAPPPVVEKERTKLAGLRATHEKLAARLADMG